MKRRKGSKKLTLNSGEWVYFVGCGRVEIRNETTKVLVDSHVILGVTQDVFERGQWKRTSDGMIKPSDVKRYIESKLI